MNKGTQISMKAFILGLAALVMAVSIQSSKAIPVNLVQNGSFEQLFAGWGYTYNMGIFAGFPGAPDGGSWGEVDGTIFQTLSTEPGRQYELTFAMAGNFNVSQSELLNVHWGNSTIGSLSWDPAGHNINNIGWVWGSFRVTATAPRTLLTFEDPFVGDGSARVAFIDAISVTAVPDASVYLTPAFAIVVAGLFWSKKWNRQAH